MSHQKIIGSILWLFLILLQFYVFDSGAPQPSYIIAAVAMFALLLYPKGWIRYKDSASTSFFFYLGYAILIQLIYTLVTQREDFLINLLFITYNLGIFLTISTYMVKNPKASKKYISLPLSISMVLLALFYFVGLGRYDFFPRYNGFFHDPNQMAHFALCSLCVILTVEQTVNLTSIISLITAIIICLASESRSSMLALISTLVGFILMITSFLKSKKGAGFSSKVLYGIILGAIVTIVVYVIKNSSRIETIAHMLSRAGEINLDQQAEERSFLAAFENIEYMFFGAGQGYIERFGVENEIHSNWIGTLFYFGLPGMVAICIFLYKCLKSLPLSLALISLGPLLYGFTTYGMRTPIFYVYIAVLYTYYRKQLVRRNSSPTRIEPSYAHKYKQKMR